jgi:hypothetical protein
MALRELQFIFSDNNIMNIAPSLERS